MDAALALGILFGVFSLDIGATERVIRSNVYTTPQKALQIAMVWVIPFIGAVVALALAEACSHTPPPNMKSDLRKSSRTYCHTYSHPDGIRVLIEFLFERSYGVPTNRLLHRWFSFDSIAEHIAISNPKTVEVLLKQYLHGQSRSRVQHVLNILSQGCGQQVTIVRFERFDPRLPPDPKAPAIAIASRRA